MRLVSTTINPKLKLGFLLLLGSFTAVAQENAPFSRYGLGDIFPSQNIATKGMAGLSAPYVDGQTVNFYNPATYGTRRIVTFDVGVTVDSRTLKSADPVKKYNSVNLIPAYVAVGMPLSTKRNFGLAFGLRPLSTVNYAIQERRRLPGIDSAATIYEGTGGLYQLFTGLGKTWGDPLKGGSVFSIGINGGVNFGRRENNTRLIFLSDTVSYAQSNFGTITTYNKTFLDAGLQYQLKLSNRSSIRLGATAKFKQTLNASQDQIKETFEYSATGATFTVDSIQTSRDFKGTIELPATYSAGLLYTSHSADKLGNRIEKSSIGLEFETAKWSEYRFYNKSDGLNNMWKLRVGAQLTPDPLSVESYWNRVNYRAGFYIGRDPVMLAGKELPVYGVTLGAGLPIRKWRSYDNQYTIINTAFEMGKRGNKENNITENFFRISFGLALSDIWFIKRRYD
jgi:hypothetical protein